MKHGKIGWAEEFHNKLLIEDIRSLRKTLRGIFIPRIDSIMLLLESFVEKIGYKNMVIWHKPNPEAKMPKSISYVLIITPQKVQLFKSYADEVLTCRWENGELVDEYFNGEGMAVVKSLFEKMLEEKVPIPMLV